MVFRSDALGAIVLVGALWECLRVVVVRNKTSSTIVDLAVVLPRSVGQSGTDCKSGTREGEGHQNILGSHSQVHAER